MRPNYLYSLLIARNEKIDYKIVIDFFELLLYCFENQTFLFHISEHDKLNLMSSCVRQDDFEEKKSTRKTNRKEITMDTLHIESVIK